MHGYIGGDGLALTGFLMILYTMFVWWRDSLSANQRTKAIILQQSKLDLNLRMDFIYRVGNHVFPWQHFLGHFFIQV